MKKNVSLKIILLILVGVILTLTGCEFDSYEMTGNKDAESYIKSNYGNYEVPEGLVRNEEHSSKSKQFYVLEEDKDKTKPNNISVNGGGMPYSKDNNAAFRQEIVQQLSQQNAGKGATINGRGTYTKNGDILYIFKITDESSVTTQYYIVGDKKYVLVHETTFDDNTEKIDEKTQEIVDSFKWNE